jgi:hypothetical protein
MQQWPMLCNKILDYAARWADTGTPDSRDTRAPYFADVPAGFCVVGMLLGKTWFCL